MIFKNKIWILFTFFIVTALIPGCVHKVPLAVDPTKDIGKALPITKKIPAKVGIYLSEDIKKYVYKQQKMAMTFQMNVGEYLVPISQQMVSAIFEEAIFVDALPPYKDFYKPDVEAVALPEIIYCYGNAIGTLSGYIEAKIKMRITAFDLSGKVLWQDEAVGESRSEELNFVSTFLGGMEKVGKTGYDAAFSAAGQIIKDFNAVPPKELYSLIEIKSLATLKNRRNISNFDLFKKYYQKGQFQYEKRNYYQALYSFDKAAQINPEDLSTIFYMGVCYTYTGQKNKALEKFSEIVNTGSKSQEAKDSKKWIDTLKEPLGIGVVIFNKTDGNKNNIAGLDETIIKKSFIESQMYELVEVTDLKPSDSLKAPDFNRFLERCSEKDIRILIYVDINDLSQKLFLDSVIGADIATEHKVQIIAKAYSTKKKKLHTEIQLMERASTLTEKTKDEEITIKQQLLKRGSEKLILRLLESNII